VRSSTYWGRYPVYPGRCLALCCCAVARVVECILFLYNEIIIHKSNQTSNDLIRPKNTTGWYLRAGTIYVLLRRNACIDCDLELPEFLHLPPKLLRPALMADVVHVPHTLYVLILLLGSWLQLGHPFLHEWLLRGRLTAKHLPLLADLDLRDINPHADEGPRLIVQQLLLRGTASPQDQVVPLA